LAGVGEEINGLFREEIKPPIGKKKTSHQKRKNLPLRKKTSHRKKTLFAEN
jgi:hypothetical protein